MMRRLGRLFRNDDGAAAVEMVIVLPILISLIWGIFQIALVFEANAGVENALGEAARYATIYPTPSDTSIKSYVTSHKFGGTTQGTWGTPSVTTSADGTNKTITVTYSQPMDFLFFQGPSVTITKSKVAYLSQ